MTEIAPPLDTAPEVEAPTPEPPASPVPEAPPPKAWVEAAAEAVLSITGFKDGQCVFLCSGSESIELARQIAKHLTGKSRSMTLYDSYLGSYSSVKDRSRQWYVFNWDACAACDQKEDCSLDCQELSCHCAQP